MGQIEILKFLKGHPFTEFTSKAISCMMGEKAHNIRESLKRLRKSNSVQCRISNSSIVKKKGRRIFLYQHKE